MKAWFLGISRREKVLVLALVLGVAGVWGTSVSQRLGGFALTYRTTKADFDEQQAWLARQDQIEADAAAAVEDLDSSRTFNGLQLSAEIESLASAAGFTGESVRIEGLPPQQTAQFTVHTAQLRLRGVEWGALLAFYDALSARAPYINIERFELGAPNRNSGLLAATLTASSVEITR